MCGRNARVMDNRRHRVAVIFLLRSHGEERNLFSILVFSFEVDLCACDDFVARSLAVVPDLNVPEIHAVQRREREGGEWGRNLCRCLTYLSDEIEILAQYRLPNTLSLFTKRIQIEDKHKSRPHTK